MPDELKKEPVVDEEIQPEEQAPSQPDGEKAEPEKPAEETEPEAADKAADATESVDAEADKPSEPAEDIETVKAELVKAQKQRDEYLAMAQRAQADFQNFKRRNSATRTEAYDEGVRETIAAILPSIDNLERAIAAAETENDALVSGVEMTLRQLMASMTRLGLEEVPALGEKFDPDIHNAVMRAPKGEGEPGTVLEVFQKGYRVKGRMIRYAMVKIASES